MSSESLDGWTPLRPAAFRIYSPKEVADILAAMTNDYEQGDPRTQLAMFFIAKDFIDQLQAALAPPKSKRRPKKSK